MTIDPKNPVFTGNTASAMPVVDVSRLKPVTKEEQQSYSQTLTGAPMQTVDVSKLKPLAPEEDQIERQKIASNTKGYQPIAVLDPYLMAEMEAKNRLFADGFLATLNEKLDEDFNDRDFERQWVLENRDKKTPQELKNAVDIFTGDEKFFPRWSDTKNYYFDKNDNPVPLLNGQKAPIGAETYSFWGREKDALDDTIFTTFVKGLFNGASSIVPDFLMMPFQQAQAQLSGVDSAFKKAYGEQYQNPAMDVLNQFINMYDAGKQTWQINQDPNSRFDTMMNDKAAEGFSKLFTGEDMKGGLSQIFDSDNWEFTGQNIAGVAGNSIGSLIGFIFGSKGAGALTQSRKVLSSAAKGIEGTTKLARGTKALLQSKKTKQIIDGTVLMYHDGINSAKEAGITGPDKYTVGLINAMGQSMLETLMGGVEGEFLSGLTARSIRKEISKATALAAKESLEKTGKVAMEDAFAKTLTTGARMRNAILYGAKLTKEGVSEGAEEVSQALYNDALMNIYKEIKTDDAQWGEMVSPDKFKEYMEGMIGGFAGGIGGKAVSGLRERRKGESIFNALQKKGGAAILLKDLQHMAAEGQISPMELKEAYRRVSVYTRYNEDLKKINIPMEREEKLSLFEQVWERQKAIDKLTEVQNTKFATEIAKNNAVAIANQEIKEAESKIESIIQKAKKQEQKNKEEVEAEIETATTQQPASTGQQKKSGLTFKSKPETEEAATTKTATESKKSTLKFTSQKEETETTPTASKPGMKFTSGKDPESEQERLKNIREKRKSDIEKAVTEKTEKLNKIKEEVSKLDLEQLKDEDFEVSTQDYSKWEQEQRKQDPDFEKFKATRDKISSNKKSELKASTGSQNAAIANLKEAGILSQEELDSYNESDKTIADSNALISIGSNRIQYMKVKAKERGDDASFQKLNKYMKDISTVMSLGKELETKAAEKEFYDNADAYESSQSDSEKSEQSKNMRLAMDKKRMQMNEAKKKLEKKNKDILQEYAVSKNKKKTVQKLIGEMPQDQHFLLTDYYQAEQELAEMEEIYDSIVAKTPELKEEDTVEKEKESSEEKEKTINSKYDAELDALDKSEAKETNKPTTADSIKPGVSELFESNPELANSVYEALGFKQSIIQDNQSYYRGQIEKPTIDKDGNLVLYGREDELYKKAGLDSKGVSMTDDLKSAIAYGNGQLEVAMNLASETYDRDIELERLSTEGYWLIQIPKNISNKIVKEAGEVKVTGDKIIIPKGQYKIEQVAEDLEITITPQQKQQAQQLYSQYLDTIFPDSKVKDIVYHASKYKFEKFDKSKLGSNTNPNKEFPQFNDSYLGFHFTSNPEYYRNRHEFGSKHEENLNEYIAILNIQKPKDIADKDEFSPNNIQFIKPEDIKNNDSIIYDYLDTIDFSLGEKTDKYTNNYVVFEPEQIHILGSKQDIDGFREFTGKKKDNNNKSDTKAEPKKRVWTEKERAESKQKNEEKFGPIHRKVIGEWLDKNEGWTEVEGQMEFQNLRGEKAEHLLPARKALKEGDELTIEYSKHAPKSANKGYEHYLYAKDSKGNDVGGIAYKSQTEKVILDELAKGNLVKLVVVNVGTRGQVYYRVVSQETAKPNHINNIANPDGTVTLFAPIKKNSSKVPAAFTSSYEAAKAKMPENGTIMAINVPVKEAEQFLKETETEVFWGKKADLFSINEKAVKRYNPKKESTAKPKKKAEVKSYDIDEAVSFEDAVLRYFLNGGSINEQSFFDLTGYKRGSAEHKMYAKFLSKDGITPDLINEAIPNMFGEEIGNGEEVVNVLLGVTFAPGAKSLTEKALKTRINEVSSVPEQEVDENMMRADQKAEAISNILEKEGGNPDREAIRTLILNEGWYDKVDSAILKLIKSINPKNKLYSAEPFSVLLSAAVKASLHTVRAAIKVGKTIDEAIAKAWFSFRNGRESAKLFDGLTEEQELDLEKGFKKAIVDVIHNQAAKQLNLFDQKEQSENPKSFAEITNHSGGAEKYDSYWDEFGKKEGLKNQNHYTVAFYDKLSLELKTKYDKMYLEAVKWLGRNDLSKDSYAGKLVRRDMIQAEKADAVFAISEIVAPKTKGRKGYINKTNHPIVEGGTGYAVASAILQNKPVYVFNQDSSYGFDIGWYKWNSKSNTFEKTNVPVLTKNFAGIGSSTHETEIGKQAIKDVYAATKKSFEDNDQFESKLIKSDEEYTEDSVNQSEVVENQEEEVRQQSFDADSIEVNRKRVVELLDHVIVDGKPMMRSDVEYILYKAVTSSDFRNLSLADKIEAVRAISPAVADHITVGNTIKRTDFKTKKANDYQLKEEDVVGLFVFYQSIKPEMYVAFMNWSDGGRQFKPTISNEIKAQKAIVDDLSTRVTVFLENNESGYADLFKQAFKKYASKMKKAEKVLLSHYKKINYTINGVTYSKTMRGIDSRIHELRELLEDRLDDSAKNRIQKEINDLLEVRQANDSFTYVDSETGKRTTVKYSEAINRVLEISAETLSELTGITKEEGLALFNSSLTYTRGKKKVVLSSPQEVLRTNFAINMAKPLNNLITQFILNPANDSNNPYQFMRETMLGENGKKAQINSIAIQETKVQSFMRSLADRFDNVVNKKKNSWTHISHMSIMADQISDPNVQARHKGNRFVEFFANRQFRYAWQDGIKNSKNNEAADNKSITKKDYELIMLSSFFNSSQITGADAYLQIIGQFADKSQIALAEVPYRTVEAAQSVVREMIASELITNEEVENSISYWENKMYEYSKIGVFTLKSSTWEEAAEQYVYNQIANQYEMDLYFLGEPNQKGLESYEKLTKRSGPFISNGLQPDITIPGGVGKTIRHATINDPKILVDIEDLVKFEGEDGPDGFSFISPEFLQKLKKSYGVFLDDSKYGHSGIIKAIYSKTNEDGQRTLVKTAYVVLSEEYVKNNPGLKSYQKMMKNGADGKGSIDILSFESAAKIVPAKYKNKVEYKKNGEYDTMEIKSAKPLVVQDLDSTHFLINSDLRNRLTPAKGKITRQVLRYNMAFKNSTDIQKMFNVVIEREAAALINKMDLMEETDLRNFYLDNIADNEDNWFIRSLIANENVSLAHPAIKTFVPNIIANKVQNDVLGIKVNKAILVEMPAVGVQLKDYEIKNGEIQPAEVLVPEDFKSAGYDIGEVMFITRVPSSNFHSTAMVKIAGFTPREMGNVIVTPPGVQKIAGADNDGDARHLWLRNKDPKTGKYIEYKSGPNAKNSKAAALNRAWELVAEEYRGVGLKGSQLKSRLEQLTNPIDVKQVSKDLAPYKSKEKMNAYVPEHKSKMFQLNSEGKDVIGIAAKFQAAYAYLKKHKAELVIPFSLPKWTGKSMQELSLFFHDQKKQDIVDSIEANNVNQATDNGKEQNLDPMGMTIGTTMAFMAIEALGLDQRSAIAYMNTPIVREYIEAVRETKSPLVDEKESRVIKKMHAKRFEELTRGLDQSEYQEADEKYSLKMSMAQIQKNYDKEGLEGEFAQIALLNKVLQVQREIQTVSQFVNLTEQAPKTYSDYLKAKELISKMRQLKHIKFNEGNPLDTEFGVPAHKNLEIADKTFRNHILNSRVGVLLFGKLKAMYSRVTGQKTPYISDETIDNLGKAISAYIAVEANEITKSPNELRTNARAVYSEMDAPTFKEFVGIDEKTKNLAVKSQYRRIGLSEEQSKKIQEELSGLSASDLEVLFEHHVIEYGFDVKSKDGGFATLFPIKVHEKYSNAIEDWFYSYKNFNSNVYIENLFDEVMVNNPGLFPVVEAEVFDEAKNLYKIKVPGATEEIMKFDDAPKFIKTSISGGVELMRKRKTKSGGALYQKAYEKNIVKSLSDRPKYQIADTSEIRYQKESQENDSLEMNMDSELLQEIQSALKSIFPDVKVFSDAEAFAEYVAGFTDEQFDPNVLGAAFADAVYINPNKAVQGTRIHEYAHIYWGLVNSDVKQQLLEQFGSEESAIEAITDVALAMKKIQSKSALKRFFDGMKTFWAGVKKALGIHNQKDLLRLFASDFWKGAGIKKHSNVTGPIRYQKRDMTDLQRKAMQSLQMMHDLIQFQKDTHTYDVLGEQFMSASAVRDLDPYYSFDGKKSKDLDQINRIGTTVHAIGEAVLAGLDLDQHLSAIKENDRQLGIETTVDFNEEIVERLVDHFTKLKEQIEEDGTIIITEHRLANSEYKYAGTSDILLLHPNGKFSIKDFKTSKESTKGSKYHQAKTSKASKAEKHAVQLALYGYALQEYDDKLSNPGYKIQDMGIYPIRYEMDKDGNVTKVIPEEEIDFDYSVYRQQAIELLSRHKERMLDNDRDSNISVVMLDKESYMTGKQIPYSITANDRVKARMAGNAALEKQLASKLQHWDKMYEQYKEDVLSVRKIVNKDIEDYTLDELIDVKNQILSYDNLTYNLFINEIDKAIAMEITKKQMEFLGESVEEFTDEDIANWQKNFLAPTDFTDKNPMMQEIMKEYFRRRRKASQEMQDFQSKLNEKMKAVIDEKEKKEGTGIVSKAIGVVTGRKEFSKYTESLFKPNSNNLKDHESEEDIKDLSASELELLKFLNESLKSFSEIQDNPENRDHSMYNLRKAGKVKKNNYRTYRKGFFPLRKMGFWEAKHNLGLNQAIKLKFEEGAGSDLYSEVVDFYHEGKIQKMPLKDAVEILEKQAETGNALQKAKSINSARKLYAQANKKYGAKRARTMKDVEETSYNVMEGHLSINKNGQLVSPFHLKEDKRLANKNLYSRDVYTTMLMYAKDMIEIKHINPIVPKLTAAKVYYKEYQRNENISEYLDTWIKGDILGGDFTTVSKSVDKWIFRMPMTLTYKIAMQLNPKAWFFNAFTGNLQAYIQLGDKYKTGVARVANWKKADAVAKKQRIVAVIDESDITNPGRGYWNKIIESGLVAGEQQITYATIFGMFTQEEWDSFTDEGDIIPGSAVDKMGQDAWIDKLNQYDIAKQDVQGKYSVEYKRLYKHNAMWAAVMQFKGWLPDFIRTRVAKEYVDMYGVRHKGTYLSLRYALRDMKEMVTNYKQFMQGTDIDAQNNRKNFRDMLAFGVLMSAAILASGGDDDDEKENKAFAEVFMNSALSLVTMIDVGSWESWTKNPVPFMATLNNILNAMIGMFDVYESSGRYGKKGDYKFWGNMVRIMPYKGITAPIVEEIRNPDFD